MLFVTINGLNIINIARKATFPLITFIIINIKKPIKTDNKCIILYFIFSSININAENDTVSNIQYIAEMKSILPIVAIKLTLCVPIPS